MTRWLYARAATKIVTTGEALRRQMIADVGIAPESIESVPTGIDTTRFAPGARLAARAKLGLPADKTLVGIVATLRSWKGHRYLIDACAALPPDTGLVIVGDGPQRESLPPRRHVGQNGVESDRQSAQRKVPAQGRAYSCTFLSHSTYSPIQPAASSVRAD